MKIRIGTPISQIVHKDALKALIGRSLTDKEILTYNKEQRDKQQYSTVELREAGYILG